MATAKSFVKSILGRPAPAPLNPPSHEQSDAVTPEDIIIAGWPKSGNTWIQSCIVGLLYGMQPEWTPDAVIQLLVPDFYLEPGFQRYQKPMFIKRHSLARPEYRRVVHLVRDGRDALVSLYHHQKAVDGVAPGWSDLIESGSGDFGTWQQHTEQWHSNPFGADVLTIRYEDMKADLPRELKRLCDFSGLERSAEMIKAAADNASFEKMKLQDQRFGQAGTGWPAGVPFVRRGQVGSHRDEMPAEAMAAFMERAAGPMKALGYI